MPFVPPKSGLSLAEDGHPSAQLLERLRGSAAP